MQNEANPDRSAELWRATSFARASDYSVDLSDADRRTIVQAVRAIAPDRPVTSLTQDDFAFGPLSERLRRGFNDVRDGRGFVLIRGLPLDITLAEFEKVVWGVGAFFGHALSQNAQGEMMSSVVDATKEDATPRMYRSNQELRLHTDICGMLSLACWHKAQEGGASCIGSAATVHDEIKARAPELLEPLYRGFHYHRLGEEGVGEEPVTPFRVPVFAVRAGRVSCRYQRAGIVGGHKALGIELTKQEIAALDLFDQIASKPENRIAFYLERGEMIVINNYLVMHARTGFTNFPEPERKRLLVRLWLDAENFRDVPKEFNHFAGGNGVPKQDGKRATFDFKKLYAENPAATGGIAKLNVSDSELVRPK